MMGTLFALVNIVQAQDRLVVSDVEIPQGGQVSLTVQYQFTEADKYAGCQFNVVLPDGITFVTNAQGNAVYEMGDCYNETPSHGGNLVAGVESFSSNGSYDNFINGTTGTLVTFTIQTSESLTVGETLTGKIQNIVMGSRTAVSTPLEDVTFNITIGEPIDKHIVLDENSISAPAPATGVDVRVIRTINADEWSTICLPFATTGEQVKAAFGDDVQLASFTGWESEEDGNGAIVAINVMFTSVSADEGIAANTPMLIKVSETVAEATFDGVTLEPAEEPMVQVGKKASERGWFYGTYAKTTVPEENLFLNDNKFWYSTGKTAIKGFRGFFEFRDVLDAYYDDSDVKVHMFFDDDATGIETIDHSSLNIDHYYNLAGQRVGKGYKGVVIENGKKVIKK